jgi:class 3 adenylate cyclase
VVIDETGEVFGDVPNVAARAQALAESDTVVVTARAQRQIAGLFVAEERGSHQPRFLKYPAVIETILTARIVAELNRLD